MNNIDLDDIRKEVALKHGEVLYPHDPILQMVTVNEIILQRYVDILAEKNEAYRKSVDAALQKGIADAKLTAGSVITNAAGHVSEQVNTAVIAAFDEGIERLQADERRREEANRNVRFYDDNVFWWGIIIGGSPGVLYIVLKFIAALTS